MFQNLDLNYPAAHFIEKNEHLIHELINHFPLANLITSQQDEIFTSYLPFIWGNANELIGHLDIQNPQIATLNEGEKVKLIFNGPENYISPSHFTTNELPTYNYCKVEVEGLLKPISNEALKNAIIQLTTQLEGKDAAYQLTQNEKRLHSLVKYIFGFKIEVLEVKGRFKMSQDKSKNHQEMAVKVIADGLKKRNANFIKQYWKQAE